ncbi:MAG: protein-glutamate O-methyltransferase CheR [Hyphomonadaceae bacterium]|nr:protein-glutamate O-methyltransferase CheR [Hyphomonadaceae bacterium]
MLTDADFATIATEVRARSGAVLTPDMGGAIEIRLQPQARREGFTSVSDYVAAARTRLDGAIYSAIADSLAQSETRFFRDRSVFKRLKEELIPQALQRKGRERIRIWSAACSTGQEPYSIAMTIEDLRESGSDPTAEIVATDFSERLIEKARSGLYTQFEIQRGLPIRKLIAYFERANDLWRISDRMRAAVRFEPFNLMKHPGQLGKFDIVVLAHVLSGFDLETRRGVLARVAEVVAPEGCIIFGAGEPLPEGVEGLRFENGVVRPARAARVAA